MMKKLAKRLISAVLAAALMAGMCLTASAFTYPSAYWPLHSAWETATAAQDPDQVITVAQQVYDLLTPLGLSQDVCANLWPKAQAASWACEIKGDIDGALLWAERQYTFNKWLTDNVGDPYNYRELLEIMQGRLRALKAAQNVTVYAQSSTAPSGYSSGPRTGTWYGVPADGSRKDGSAVLVYVDFGDSHSVEYWLNYYQHNSQLYQKAANGGVIELAWNFNPESTAGAQAVLSADSYIEESLKALSKVNATILLRVGAEMNCWSECDPEVFKQAFRKIASAARKYSNIQTVFSPNDISNLNATIEMYYPGDGYVDWIGMSTYHGSNYKGWYGDSSYRYDYSRFYDDAFYGVGIYDNDPLVTIQPIIDLAKAHGKPVMISECGSSWRGSDGSDQTSYAVEQVNWIYSYVNMVYPQVKAVFYFDNGKASDTGLVYRLDTSAAVNSAYESAIRANGAYLANAGDSAVGWEPLDKASVSAGDKTLRLAAYASFPGRHSTTVKYYVDNTLVHTSTQAPHYYDLDLSKLSGGTHTLRVDAAGGQFSRSSQTYTLTIPGDTPVVPTAGSFTDVKPGDFFAEPVKWAVEQNITAGTSKTTFSPNSKCTVAQILSFLWRASGSPEPTAANPFSNVKPADFYYKAALWAAEQGMVSGSEFAANTPCTRSMAVNYMWKAAGSPAPADKAGFSDVSADADYAQAVAWAVEQSVTAGTSKTTFSPNSTCTRGQIVTFLYRGFAK